MRRRSVQYWLSARLLKGWPGTQHSSLSLVIERAEEFLSCGWWKYLRVRKWGMDRLSDLFLSVLLIYYCVVLPVQYERVLKPISTSCKCLHQSPPGAKISLATRVSAWVWGDFVTAIMSLLFTLPLVVFCRNLGDNAIRSIQADAFAKMKSLRQL